MNPVVGVAEAMMERRRQRGSFSQVIQGESNEEDRRRRRKPYHRLLRVGKRRGFGETSMQKKGNTEEGEAEWGEKLYCAT